MMRTGSCPVDFNRFRSHTENLLIDVKQLSENYMVEMIKNCLHVHIKLLINSLIPYMNVTASLSVCTEGIR